MRLIYDQQVETRSFRMGFSGIPPRADFDLALTAIEMWRPRADVAIVSPGFPGKAPQDHAGCIEASRSALQAGRPGTGC